MCVDDVATAVVNPHFDDFLREANKGRTTEEERAEKEPKARGDARELVEMESSFAGGHGDGDGNDDGDGDGKGDGDGNTSINK